MKNEEMVKAVDQFNKGHKEAAFKTIHKLELSNPNNLDIKYNYALMLGLSGNYAEEQKKYKEIITINQNDCGAYVNLAVSLNETNNYQEAIQYSSSALNINPDIAEAYEARGIAKQHQDLIEEANLDFRRWLNLSIKNECISGFMYYLCQPNLIKKIRLFLEVCSTKMVDDTSRKNNAEYIHEME
jgi:tetratricopeptide (TPR) repeat protein